MIGVLRFVGVLNAAVWLGSAFFVTCGAIPAFSTVEMKSLLGSTNYPYFSGAVSQIVQSRYSHVLLLCSLFALVHVTAEWLYLGRVPLKVWRWLLSVVVGLSLVSGLWIQPVLQKLHTARHAVNLRPERQEAAARSFGVWRGIQASANFLLICGISAYLWRLTNSPEGTRFVSAVKFRS